jgi:hypothetical protein
MSKIFNMEKVALPGEIVKYFLHHPANPIPPGRCPMVGTGVKPGPASVEYAGAKPFLFLSFSFARKYRSFASDKEKTQPISA